MPTNAPTVEEVQRLLEKTEEKILDDGYTSKSGWESTIAALCRRFLASPMTAGEFAGAVIAEFARWENAKGGATSPFMAGRRAAFASAAKLTRDLAREHNITIAEMPK